LRQPDADFFTNAANMAHASPETTLPQRVLESYDDLSRGERRLADLLLENPDLLALRQAGEIATRAGVSRATAARFFRRLGYPSFRAAQRRAREDGTSAAAAPPAPGRPGLLALAARAGAGGNGAGTAARLDLSQHLAADVQNLVRTVEALRPDEVGAAALAMARAEKLWVVGFGDNYALAHYARALLIRVKPDIRMIPIGGFSIPEEFASIGAADAMLALGVGRRTRSLRSVMRSAVRAGATVVLVTDQAAPAGPDAAAVTIRCRTKGAGVFESAAAPVSVLAYLCSSLALRIGQAAIERLEAIDAIHDEWGDLLPGDL
jgi:DNA-binding MurR/RpiR family transcriptional regulator